MTEAFMTKAIADGAWHIQDARGAVMYLVAGQERALLTKRGIEHIYRTIKGAAHTWVVWRSFLYYELLPRLWRS